MEDFSPIDKFLYIVSKNEEILALFKKGNNGEFCSQTYTLNKKQLLRTIQQNLDSKRQLFTKVQFEFELNSALKAIEACEKEQCKKCHRKLFHFHL